MRRKKRIAILKKKLIAHKYIFIFAIFLMLIYFSACFIFSFLFASAESNQSAEKSNLSFNSVKYSNTDIASIASVSVPLIFDSFFDSFANSYQIDSSRTNLYRDNSVTAVYFPPEYTWDSADSATIFKNENKFSEFSFNDFSAPAYEKRCLKNKCLEQKDNKLYFDDQSINFPQDIKVAEVAAISLGVLDSNWLVGITLKEGESDYSGKVYYYDGKNFSALGINGKIDSPYFGIFGFGGEDADFLITYGAYKGIAYRIQGKSIINISQFFDYRLMDGGFRSEVIRAEGGGHVNWYVFSLTATRPHLIKLWQDKAGAISGEMEYQGIFSDGKEKISFAFLSADSNKFSLLAKINRGGSYEWKVLNDYGFKNKSDGVLFFTPVVYDKPVTLKKLVNSSLGSLDFPCSEGKLMFSLDSEYWQTIPLGQALNSEFCFPSVEKFFLKVNLPAQTDKFYSPFLNEVLFDLYYQK